MELMDGTGSGFRAKIDTEGRLWVTASTQSPQQHASMIHELAFQVPTGIVNKASAGLVHLLSIKNVGITAMAISYIRVGVDAAEIAQAKVELLLRGTWDGTGGTDIDPINVNTGTAKELTALVQTGAEITTPDVIDSRWCRGPAECVWNKEGAVILATNGVFGIRVTTETADVDLHGRVSIFNPNP